MSNYPLWGTIGDTDGMVVDPPVWNGTSAGKMKGIYPDEKSTMMSKLTLNFFSLFN